MRGKILQRKKQRQTTSILLLLVISLIANSYLIGHQSTGLNKYLNASYDRSGELVAVAATILHQQKNSTQQYVSSQIPKDSNPLQPSSFIDSPPYIEQYTGSLCIRALEYDSLNDRLFFASKGIGVFYPENDSIFHFTLTSKNYFPLEHSIHKMLLNANATKLYVATYAGLFVVTTVDFSFSKFNTSDGLAHDFVRSLALDEATNRLFISTDDGLSIFYTNNETFADTSNLPYSLTFGGVGNFAFNAKTKELYTTGCSGTAYSYNTSSNILSELVHFSSTADSLFLDGESQLLYCGGCPEIIIFNCTSRTVIAAYDSNYNPAIYNIDEAIVFEPSYGGMIFASKWKNGTVVLNTSSGEVSIIRREHGLLSNYISSLAIITNTSTAEPLLAIGVRGAIALYDIKLGVITKTVVFEHGLPTGNVWVLDLEKTTDQVFIGNSKCLSIFNISSKQFTNYDYVHGLPQATCTATILDSTNNRLFVATTGGLSIFDLALEQVVKVYGEVDGLAADAVYSLAFFEPENKLFIGTQNGFSVLDLTTDQIENHLEDKWINMFVLDEASQQLFIASFSNVYVYCLETEIVEPLLLNGDTSIAGVYSIQVYPEKQILFVGTGKGVYVLDLQQKTILKHFTAENSGLTDSLIDGGLSFDPATETLFIGNLGIVLYDFAHDFWINTNDAYLEDEGLYRPYVNDIVYYNNILYLALPHGGFFTLSLNDTDGDGIYDCYEDWLFGTDLNLYDTDGDGFSDGEELWRGKDPLDPYSYPYDWLCWFARVLIPPVTVFGGIITVIAFSNYLTRKKEKHSDSSQEE